MTEYDECRDGWIADRIQWLTKRSPPERQRIFRDTTGYMSIDRGDLVDLEGELYLVRGNAHEGRFGLHDQPKFWVKSVQALGDGNRYFLKLVFHEEFKVRIGTLQIRCRRSGEKEGRVLDLVRGDGRFMQGRIARDARNNLVRILDFIPGDDLLTYLVPLPGSHERYFHDEFPAVLARTTECIAGLQQLHHAGLCHGDIRNDHILIDGRTGSYRWIDFDLTQDFSDFDVWSVGNILQVVVGKGLVTFQRVIQEHPELDGAFSADEASVFYPHRLMNLRKVYPYIPPKLNQILMRFSKGTETFYETVDQIVEDLGDCAADMGWPAGS